MLQANDYLKMYKSAAAFDTQQLSDSYQRQYGVDSEYADRLVDGLHKWLTVCALEPNEGYALFGEVDLIWHEFILDTEKYEEYCEKSFGRFMHHAPPKIKQNMPKANSHAESQAMVRSESALNAYARLGVRIVELFGDGSFDEPVWPQPSKLNVNKYHTGDGAANEGSGHSGCGCGSSNRRTS